jgi:hypothetical protein
MEWLFLSDNLRISIMHPTFDNIVQGSTALGGPMSRLFSWTCYGSHSRPAQQALDEGDAACLAEDLSHNVSQVLRNVSATPLVMFKRFSVLSLESPSAFCGSGWVNCRAV